MANPLELYSLVLIEWLDATSNQVGWKPMNEIQATKLSRCTSVGWLVKQTKEKYVLVSSIHHDDLEGDGDLILPAAWVKRIKVLRHAKKK